MTEYFVPTGQSETEYVEKRSRFIAHVWPVETEEEARAHIEATKKKHYDARHNCWCYRLKNGIERYSDDGEPQGTAGQPMLNVFQREEIVNVCCVVTRYFGGILLGAGGLVRAYTESAKEGLDCCKIATMSPGKRVKIHTDYNTIGKVLHELGQRGFAQEDSEYTDVIALTVTVPMADFEAFEKKITEISAGKSHVETVEEVYFAKVKA